MDGDAEREALEAIIRRAKLYIEKTTKIPSSNLAEPHTEPVFWRDSAMGLPPIPGEPVKRKHRPGYILLFDTPHGQYRFHADITTNVVQYDSRSSR